MAQRAGPGVDVGEIEAALVIGMVGIVEAALDRLETEFEVVAAADMRDVVTDLVEVVGAEQDKTQGRVHAVAGDAKPGSARIARGVRQADARGDVGDVRIARVGFYAPNTSFGNPNFGRVTGALPARSIQMGMKLYW